MHRILLLSLSLALFSLSSGASAEMLWSMSHDDEYGSWGCSAHLLQDGEIVITGYIVSFPDKMSDLFLIKSDIEGNIIWTRTVKEGDKEISMFGELPAGVVPHIEPLESNEQKNPQINPAINYKNITEQDSIPVIAIADNPQISGNVEDTYLFNIAAYWNKFTEFLNSTQNKITSLLDN